MGTGFIPCRWRRYLSARVSPPRKWRARFPRGGATLNQEDTVPNRVQSNSQYPEIEISEAWYRRAQRRIPALTQTLAKGPTQYVRGVAPIYLQRGKGARVWDVDGNEYLDFNMAIGPLSLGYAYERVDQAIQK